MKNKFISGPGHIFNPVPGSDEEVLAHGNALAESGNYPVGTNACFNVGISGGCEPTCFEYLRGGCPEPEEFAEAIAAGKYKNEITIEQHYEIYNINGEPI